MQEGSGGLRRANSSIVMEFLGLLAEASLKNNAPEIDEITLALNEIFSVSCIYSLTTNKGLYS